MSQKHLPDKQILLVGDNKAARINPDKGMTNYLPVITNNNERHLFPQRIDNY